MNEVTLFPEQASVFAQEVDQLFWFFTVVCGLAGTLTALVVFVFSIVYRRGARRYAHSGHHSTLLEIGWTLPVAVVVMALFVWGAKIFINLYNPPESATEVYITGKQWMWKIQHPNGKREINELHVPVNTDVTLNLTSEDVIHSFFVPAFRTKRDAVPGRYSRMWFNATKTGSFHIFCAEYCGTDHSRMIGTVFVMPEQEYQEWLRSGAQELLSMADKGAMVYARYACGSCHEAEERGPSLESIYGQQRELAGGNTVLVDESYLRESILRPNAKVTEGYAPIMPTFKGQIDEQSLNELIAYIKSLSSVPAERASMGGN
ncbi:MAG: cytochrome c oxidase subunit II [Myxococcales bacterium]|nr:cytochrome c oxidase subunit II [Myxococcales bacterium]